MTPTQDEIGFGRSIVRENNEHFFAAVLLLKCLEYLGYFPELSVIPAAIVNHVRVCLRLAPDTRPTWVTTPNATNRTLRKLDHSFEAVKGRRGLKEPLPKAS